MTEAWAVYRELAHSPGRETDDALILRSVAEKLDFSVALKTPDEVIDEPSAPPLVLVMCERLEILGTLRRWEQQGSLLINTPAAIFETYRHRMIEAFARDGVSFPKSELIALCHPERSEGPACHVTTGHVANPNVANANVANGHVASGSFAALRMTGGCWVKRADVHATEAGDVQFAADESALQRALSNLKARGITRAVLQQHVPGDLIKFYGAGDWFVWFYHRDQKLNGHAFEIARLRDAARKAAGALGVEIFGGDAIVQRDGDLSIIDLNAWPSFALYRDEASTHIAAYVAARVEALEMKCKTS